MAVSLKDLEKNKKVLTLSSVAATEEPHVDAGFRRLLLLPALILSMFLLFTGTVLTSTLLVDIASSLKVSIGTASQLGLVASLGE